MSGGGPGRPNRKFDSNKRDVFGHLLVESGTPVRAAALRKAKSIKGPGTSGAKKKRR